jgi:transcriptional regulator with XRE-family HTH domain
MLRQTKTCRKRVPVMSKATLGGFIADQMRRRQLNNLNLAQAAGISEGAVRNLLKHGSDPSAKDPDARTLRRVAEALRLDPILLYRMAGYLPTEPNANSVHAEFVADVFDSLSPDKQDAVIGLLEAMADRASYRRILRAMRDDSKHPLAGFDLESPYLVRIMANTLIAELQMTDPVEVERIPPEQQIIQYKWGDLPQSTQERIKSLIRHKLSLDYDPTMVDPEWRS